MRSNSAHSVIVALGVCVVAIGTLTMAGERPFVVYDNMYYKGKPNTAPTGLVASNIVYENKIWPNKQDVGKLPNRGAYVSLVRTLASNPGPLVIDVETLPLRGTPDVAKRNMETLATLADWAHEAAPGKVVGFYGTNTLSKVPPASLPLARELAKHVDAFFPPMYTFDDDRSAYEKRAKDTVAEGHELGASKPVYFYLWPQYHDGTPKAFQHVDAEYWAFQLETARRLSDGIVLWSPSRFTWDNSSRWWTETERFVAASRTISSP